MIKLYDIASSSNFEPTKKNCVEKKLQKKKIFKRRREEEQSRRVINKPTKRK